MKNWNKYDWLLMGVMTLLAGGSIGGFAQPIRLVWLSIAPFFIYTSWKDPRWLKDYKQESIFMAFWWLWAAVSLIWSKNGFECVKLCGHLGIYMLAFMEIMQLARKGNEPMKAVLLGWIAMIWITIPIATIELLTDWHPSTCSNSAGCQTYLEEGQHIQRYFAAALFDNINAYNMVLVLSLTPTFAWIWQATTQTEEYIGYLSLAALCIMIPSNSSRAALFCLGLALVLFTIFSNKKKERVIGTIAILLIAGWFIMGLYGISLRGCVMAGRMQHEGVSDHSRALLYPIGLEAIKQSYGLGIGCGNMGWAIAQHGLRWRAIHCLWLEIGMQYGLIILAGFCLMLLKLLIQSWKNGKECFSIMLIGLLMLGGSTFSDGTMLLKAQLWMYLALLYIILPNYKTQQQPQ